MRSLPLSAALLAMLAAPMAHATSPVRPASPLVVGGWSQGPVDARARAAARFALTRLGRGKAIIRSIDRVERQVVAGSNYRIDMTLSDKSRWRVTVWQRLDGRYRLTASERLTAATAAQGQLIVTGRIAYRERMALVPGSIVTISLDDVSRADAPARRLTSQRIVVRGQQVPLPFTLSVPRSALPGPGHNSVSARIEGPDGRLMFITDTMNSVEPDERGNSVDMGTLMLVRAGG